MEPLSTASPELPEAGVAEAPVSRALWAHVMQRPESPEQLRLVDVAAGMSLVEAALFANRASAAAGIEPCYDLSCKAFPDEGGGVATGERLMWLLSANAGCPRLDQPWCVDARSCTVVLRPETCGFRLPMRSEWLLLHKNRKVAPTGAAEWVWPDGVDRLNTDDVAAVAGATVLSSTTASPDRVVPVVGGMKAMHIGFRMARGPIAVHGGGAAMN